MSDNFDFDEYCKILDLISKEAEIYCAILNYNISNGPQCVQSENCGQSEDHDQSAVCDQSEDRDQSADCKQEYIDQDYCDQYDANVRMVTKKIISEHNKNLRNANYNSSCRFYIPVASGGYNPCYSFNSSQTKSCYGFCGKDDCSDVEKYKHFHNAEK
jgi:hypothetical protein